MKSMLPKIKKNIQENSVFFVFYFKLFFVDLLVYKIITSNLFKFDGND